MSDVFSTGRSAAKKAQKKQEELIAQQSQKEKGELAESEDVIARRKALAASGTAGRRSLIRTSEAGTGARSSLG